MDALSPLCNSDSRAAHVLYCKALLPGCSNTWPYGTTSNCALPPGVRLLYQSMLYRTCPTQSCGCGLPSTMRQVPCFVSTGIFIISGLGLRRGEAARALSAWGAIAFGAASILAITPLAALAVQRLPLGSPELTLGLAVFCCMPTTLSSGVSLTQVTAHLCCMPITLSSGVSLTQVTPASAPELLMVTHALCPRCGNASLLRLSPPSAPAPSPEVVTVSLPINEAWPTVGFSTAMSVAMPTRCVATRPEAAFAEGRLGVAMQPRGSCPDSGQCPSGLQGDSALYAVLTARHGQPCSFLPPGALSSGCCKTLACGQAGPV